MRITLSPVAINGPETSASVAGDVLTVDGTPLDFSAVPEGGTATWDYDAATDPAEAAQIVGPVTRTGGEIVLKLIWFYDPLTSAPAQADPGEVTVTAGAVPDPIARS